MSSTPPTETAAPARPRTRVPLWDNARFLLMFCIVSGHMIETLRSSSNAAYLIYVYVYLFHVAALLLISGFFSRPDLNHKTVRSVVQLVVLWLIWEVIFTIVYHYTENAEISPDELIVPSWGLWFLLTLASLRVLLPIMARMRWPFLTSLGLALAAGIVPEIGTEFSASRTLFFLPFFVLGWLAKERGWATREWFLHPKTIWRVAAGGLFVVVGLVLLAVPDLEDRWRLDKWALGRASYRDLLEPGKSSMIDVLRPLGVGENEMLTDFVGIIIRTGIMGIAAAMTLALLILVPRRELWRSRMLTRTLYVYLLHIFIIVLLRAAGFIDWAGEFAVPGVLGLVAFALALTVVLSTDLVAKLTRPIIEPNVDWFLRQDDESGRDTRKAAPRT